MKNMLSLGGSVNRSATPTLIVVPLPLNELRGSGVSIFHEMDSDVPQDRSTNNGPASSGEGAIGRVTGQANPLARWQPFRSRTAKWLEIASPKYRNWPG